MSAQPLAIDQAVVLVGDRGPGPAGLDRARRRKILGLTVLERLILSAHQAGVREFFLVGPDGAPAEQDLPCPAKDKRFRRDDLKMEFVTLSRLQDLVRRGRFKDRFWLFDADVVFDPAILAEAGPDDPSPLRAVGPGVRICRREMLPQAAEAPGRPRHEASGAPGLFSIRVRSREDEKAAARYILGTGRRPQDGFMARHFIRPASLWITKCLLALDITPNMITAVSLALGGLSIWLVARGDPRSAVLAGCVFQLASVLDHCDGANARMTFRVSKAGSAVDVLGDALIYVLFFLGLPVGLYRADGRRIWLLLGLVVLLSMTAYYIGVFRMARAAGGGSISVASGSLFSFHKEIEKRREKGRFPQIVERVASRIAFIFRREFFPTAVLIILVFAGPKTLMAVVSLFYIVMGIYITLFANKRLREQALKGG